MLRAVLIEALHRHLALARQGLLTTRRFPVWLDDQRRAARMLEILESQEPRLGDERARHWFEANLRRWEGEYLSILVEHLIAGLASASLLHDDPAKDDATLDQSVRQVLAIHDLIDADQPSPTGIRGQRLVACARQANERTRSERAGDHDFDIRRYADELQLVRTARGEVTLRHAGEVLLGLRGRDVMRWLLAVEVSAALGDQDRWRIDATRARALADERHTRTVEDGDPPPWPWDYETKRFELEGLVEVTRHEDHGVPSWLCRVTPFGAELFGELLQPSGEVLRSLARSTLADEAHLAIHGRPPVVSEVSGLARHTKMVAHELRNALVPVQLALKQLRRKLASGGVVVESVTSMDTVASGIERALRFVVEAARMASQGAAGDELFGAVAAIRDAVESVQPEIRHPIELHAPADVERVYLRGRRDHFVLALLNLLRNAVQVGGAGVRVFITCETTARTQKTLLSILIEDDGPGVPADKQSEIFADGVSLRTGGTGQGLALVREVVEDELNGSVHYEASPRGGARFVLRLPIPLEGQS